MRKIWLILTSASHLCGCTAINVNNTDDWTTINQTDIYRNLDTCAQLCVQGVNDKIWDIRQARHCESWGCVCSNSTKGENFLNGQSNITSCVAQSCGGQSDKIESAIDAYDDLCLVYALNSTRVPVVNGTILRVTSEGYSDITDCAKFVLNGCLDGNGTRNEPHCSPLKKADAWEAYKGVADQRQCNTSACLCGDEYFDVSIGVAYDAGMKFCAMRPSTKALPNPQLDDILNVMATYCASYGFVQRNFTYQYTGGAPDSAATTGLSVDSKIQIGLASAALGVALVALYVTFRMFTLAKSAPDR